MFPLRPLLPCLLALAACAPMPRIDTPEAVGRGAAPVILPLDDLLRQAQPGLAAAALASESSLNARAAALRARAALMRGPVNDPETRARLLLAAAG